MGLMDNMGDMNDKRREFEMLKKREDDGVIDEAGRNRLQQLRSELFGKDTM
jgi:hypothetical protein